MQNLLIVFVKNPELGNVKSRLAKSIGDEMALSVYKKLLKHTRSIVVDLKMNKQICYSNRIVYDDLWEADKFQKSLQQGNNLGERMHNAIVNAYREGYAKVCIIGSDLLELKQEIVEEAFQKLQENDVVVGPAEDGGYYLIAINRPEPTLFKNKAWGTKTVLTETIANIKDMKRSFFLLPVLNDIDEIEDIKESDRGYLLS